MNLYKVSIKKVVLSFSWVNVWEILAPDLATADAAATDLLHFELSIHLDMVHFTETLTARSPDPTHQDFISTAIDQYGQRASGGGPAAAPELCAFVALSTGQGRSGKKMFRYCLTPPEVKAGGDGPVLGNGSGLPTTIANANSALLTQLATTGAELVVGKTTPRQAGGLVLKGVSVLQTHHKYYDLKHKLT